MKPTLRLLLAASLACSFVASAADASRGAKTPPAAEPPQSRDWSEPPDFEALRAEWAARPDFDALCETGRPLSAAFEAMQASRWDDLIALAEPWTERCPVDMEAHSLEAFALGNAGRGAEAEDHEMWSRGLFEAALASGDGKTPASAYRVIAEFEEYALLRAFRYPAERQAKAANGADELTVLADGETQKLYFDVLPRAVSLAASVDRRTARH